MNKDDSMQYLAPAAAGLPAALHGRDGVMRKALACLLAFLAVLLCALASSSAVAQDDFLPPEEAFVFSAATTTPDAVDIHFKIAPKYYMYRERFAFAAIPDATPSWLGTPVFPDGIVTYDPTFEKDLEVYYDQVTVRLPLMAGAPQPLTLAVTGQGCADAGLCYPPMTQEIVLTPTEGGYKASGKAVKASVPGPQPQGSVSKPKGATGALGFLTGPGSSSAASADATSDVGFRQALDLGDTGFASYLAAAGWLEIMLLCLALGVLLSFTPCVLPMVPILLAIVAGDAGHAHKVTRGRGLGLAAVFVLGMSIVYTALGVTAALIGASLAIWLQTPWVLALFAIILALLALAMFDVFTVQTPVGLQSALNQRLSRLPGGKYGGVFLMGMLSALIVGPCVAAPLAGVLLFISQTGDLVVGASALFALAWGEGLLLLLVGATSGRLMPKAGPWMEGVKRLFGVLLFATAWWMVQPIVADWIAMLGWAILAAWAATLLGAFEAIPSEASAGRYLSKALGLLMALWAGVLIVSLAAGGRDLFAPLTVFTPTTSTSVAGAGAGGGVAASAIGRDAVKEQFTRVQTVAELDHLLANTDRPVMLDFYADWCVSCIQMEKFTFTDPAVAKQMSDLVLVQADVTRNTADDRELLKRFRLFGPPGIIFFDGQGQELDDARVVGFKAAGDFSAVLAGVLQARP
ncbi:protein-disulfide reductase DsbD [Parapusillimonas sp. SGNA-6]|nr:protein-disulfide reductase DsbD [Parapusillimonas sp. SGNA-6]